jgi:hypothetical protein
MRIQKLLLFLCVGMLAISSCRKNDLGEGSAKPVALTIRLQYGDDVSALNLPKQNAVIKISNTTSGNTNQVTTNAEGIGSFASIAPGTYTINASITIPAATYSSLSGTTVDEDVVFNGNLTAQSIVQATNEITIQLSAGRLGDWVFKQIYYAGSNTSTGAAFRDQFVEIYNNSNQTLYADSLCFGQVYGVNNTTANYPAHGYLTSNQYDWSQSVGMNVSNANQNYVYLRSLYMVPGTGTRYPVEPGKSIIIAQTALDHTNPYTMNDGQQQGITNPALTVNLANADFETYLVDYKRANYVPPANNPTAQFTPYKWDLNNPAVTNMEVIYLNSGNDMILDNVGRDAFVIFKPGKDPKGFPMFPEPTVLAANVNASTERFYQIPDSLVVDAVEIQRTVETQRVPKRLQNKLDAGPAHVTGGQYTSQSLVRKTVRTVGTRRVLRDTNNSANDFFTKQKADPSKSEASFTE